MVPFYHDANRAYRRSLRVAKQNYALRTEQRLIIEAQQRPYRWLRSERRVVACPVPGDQLESHFTQMFAGANTTPSTIPQYSAAWSQVDETLRDRLARPFTLEEVAHAVLHAPLGKAAGPDLVKKNRAPSAGPAYRPGATRSDVRSIQDGNVTTRVAADNTCGHP